MGKKNKNKSKAAAAPRTPQSKSDIPADSPSSIGAVFQCQLDKDALCQQFDSLIESSPEEGIQAARDLYIHVMKKKLCNEKRVAFLREKTQSLRSDVSKSKELLNEEVAAMMKTTAQKEKLQSLSEGLTQKKEELLREATTRAAEVKASQQARTAELISETQEISAKLEQYSVKRQEYAEENVKLKDKLRVVLDAYQAQEDEFNKAVELKAAQMATASNKLEEQRKQQQEHEELDSGELDKRMEAALQAETELKQQLLEKSCRFEEFQAALTKSNDAFKDFKGRMEEKARLIATVEKENKQLTVKKDKTEQTIKDMATEIASSRRQTLAATEKQVQQLTGLCAALKVEIAQLSGDESP
mmetsp:Transcript_9161/g.15444  ORF Transcript_9161/g.15444 Transcript_9161/m.15444 type:complete len:358 (-) Transcript_9161:42-1115(-)